jgi:hypothetical protein
MKNYMEDKMKRLVLIGLLTIPLLANEQLLEVYTDKAFLTQKFEVGSGKFEVNLPEFITLDALHVKSACEINHKSLGALIQAQSPHLTKLNDAQKKLEEAKKRLYIQEAKERLLERMSLKSIDMDSAIKETEEFGKVLEELLDKKAQLAKDVEVAKEEYEALMTDSMTQRVKPLTLSLECNGPSVLELRYPVKSLDISRKNRFEGDLVDGSLKIDQNLFITHKLGVTLNNVTLHLYGQKYHERLSPPKFYPQYINDAPLQAKRSMVALSAPMGESMQKVDSIVQTSQSKQFWEISGLNLPSNETVQISLDRQEVFVDFDTFIDGYSQGIAYVRGKFKAQKPIYKATSEFVLGGVLVGSSTNESFSENKESEIFFGKNDFISVDKNLIEDFTTSNPAQKTQTTQVMYEYALLNKDAKTHKITLKERVPVSKSGNIHVNILGDKPFKTTALGEVIYQVEIKPGEEKKIKFGYIVTKPLEN